MAEQPTKPSEQAESGEGSNAAEAGLPEASTPETEKFGAPTKMEIHHPDKPIHSKKDFLVHMMTVVLGILIALGLEAMVEWGHHRALVSEARENILLELRKNRETVNKTRADLKSREEELNHIVAVAGQLESHPESFKSDTLNVAWTTHELYATAWKTASTSGAATYMKYEELRRYTDVYDSQADFSFLEKDGYNSVLAHLFPLIQSTMSQDLIKQNRAHFVEMQEDAYRGLLVVHALGTLCQDLDRQYGEILDAK